MENISSIQLNNESINEHLRENPINNRNNIINSIKFEKK